LVRTAHAVHKAHRAERLAIPPVVTFVSAADTKIKMRWLPIVAALAL
jgi:hypothetical protein